MRRNKIWLVIFAGILVHGLYWGGVTLIYHQLLARIEATGRFTMAHATWSGYPFHWHITIAQPVWQDSGTGVTIMAPAIVANAHFLSPLDYTAEIQGTMTAHHPMTDITIQHASISGHIDQSRAVELHDIDVNIPIGIGVPGQVKINRITANSHQQDNDFAFDANIDGIGATMPAASVPASTRITVSGVVPRDMQGQKVRVDPLNWSVQMDPLAVKAAGQLAVNQAGRYDGSFRLSVMHIQEMLQMLSQDGKANRQDLQGFARIAAMLGRPGPDGQPVLETDLVISDGLVRLGWFPIGRLPDFQQYISGK